MGKIPMVYSEDTLSFFIDGVPYQVDNSMATFEEVKDELKKDDPDTDRLIALTQPAQAIAAAVTAVESVNYLPRGVVSVTRNSVSYNGETISGVLVDRILSLLSEGFDIMPMVRFLENLYTNPADFARDELYLWLEGSNLPITEDGHFLAYKNVRGDFKSIHDGRTDNTPGTIVSMPREEVDPIRDRTCSRGLHFCSASYLPNFSHAQDGKTVLLKINPADVVSIPSDYNNAKGRAWKYEVLSVVDIDPQTHDWPSVVGERAEEISPAPFEDQFFDTTSEKARLLFSTLREVGLGDREDRLEWAWEILTEAEELDPQVDVLESFNDLTNGQADVLIDVAQSLKAELNRSRLIAVDKETEVRDNVAQLFEKRAEEEARASAERKRINSLGIIALRREASARGYQGAWKGPRAQDLRDFLISKV